MASSRSAVNKTQDLALAVNRAARYFQNLLLFKNGLLSSALEPCDLSGLLVQEIDLSNMALGGLKASRAWLKNADLSWSELTKADFCRAYLRGAKLNGAKLNEAKLTRAVLTGAELICAELIYAKLDGAKLNEAELNYAELTRAELIYAELNYAKLNGAKLHYAKLHYAKLDGAKLNGAKLHYAKLLYAKLNDAELIGAELNEAELNCAELNGATLNYAKLTGAKLSHAELIGANLVGADLSGADVSGTKFTLLPSILTANFRDTKNFDKAVFYTRNGARVTGIAIGADGHLVPAADVPAAKAGPVQNFGAVAQNAVAFKDIYPGLLAEARAKGYVLPEHAPNTGLAAAAPGVSAP